MNPKKIVPLHTIMIKAFERLDMLDEIINVANANGVELHWLYGAGRPSISISRVRHKIIALIKLRHDLTNKEIGNMFGIHETTVGFALGNTARAKEHIAHRLRSAERLGNTKG